MGATIFPDHVRSTTFTALYSLPQKFEAFDHACRALKNFFVEMKVKIYQAKFKQHSLKYGNSGNQIDL